jgi:Flp pilus assembly protein TadG
MPQNTTAAAPHHHGERGSASIQMTVLMPLLFLIVFTALQTGLYFYGRTAALSAATTGARAAAAESGTSRDCEAAVVAFIASLGDVLTEPRITCVRTATTATASVAGITLGIVPGLSLTVDQTAIAPVERVT